MHVLVRFGKCVFALDVQHQNALHNNDISRLQPQEGMQACVTNLH